MSKNSLTIQTNTAKPALKPKTSAKGFDRNLTLDLNKYDLRSPSSSGLGGHERHFYSPTVPSEKGGPAQNQNKSPRSKNNFVTITTDNMDPKEGANYDTKIHPQTTKTLRASYLASNAEKFKQISTSNEKVVPTKPRESFVKVGAPKYEAFLSKKVLQTKEGTKPELTLNLKDSRTRIMEEPPKKFSMPGNLILTPNNHLHLNPGSNSHRTPSNPATTEQLKVNAKPPATAQLSRKDSHKMEMEESLGVGSVVTSKHPQTHHPLSALLAELGTVSPKHSQGASRVNIGNMTGGNGHTGNLSENISSPKEAQNTTPSNDLIRLLNDKNKEIYKLTNDKLELRTTLESLNSEINGLKRMKMMLREKEKAIEDLQNSLREAVKESDDLKRELQKENVIPLDINGSDSQTPSQNRKNNNNLSAGDMEGIKLLISQLKALTDGSDQGALEQKKNSGDVAARKNTSAKGKRTEPESFSLDKRGDRGSQQADTYSVSELYQRNFSNTLEDTGAKKNSESPYYEAIKNTVRRNAKGSTEVRKDAGDTRKAVGESQNNKALGSSNIIIKKGDSILGTPRKLNVSPDKVEKQFRVQPNTTTGADADILSRKFSHDPKLISKGASDLLSKKQSLAEAGSTLAYTSEKEGAGEPLDIGKALGELKNRIGRLLNKHKDDHRMLKDTYYTYLKKFQELAKN